MRELDVSLSPPEVEAIRTLLRGEAFGETQLDDIDINIVRSILRKLAESELRRDGGSMARTRTYALQGRQPPGWMHIMPIEPFTEKQWVVVHMALNKLRECQTDIALPYVTAEVVAALAGVGKDVTRRALEKLVQTGLLRKTAAAGPWPAMYRRNVRRP